MSSKFKHSTHFDQTPTKFEPSHMKLKPDKKEALPLSLSHTHTHAHTYSTEPTRQKPKLKFPKTKSL